MTHKKVKYRKVSPGELDCPFSHVYWKHTIARETFIEAENYLTLIMPLPDARAYRKALWDNRENLGHYEAKDILRSAKQDILPLDHPEIDYYIDKMKEDTEFSPVILIRGNYQRPLCIVHGYEKICTMYYAEPAMMIPAVIV